MEHITITFDDDTTNIDLNAPTNRAVEALAHILAEYMHNAVKTHNDTTAADEIHEAFTQHLIYKYNTLTLENMPQLDTNN